MLSWWLTQKTDRSCLPLCPSPNAFVQSPDGAQQLELQYMEEDACRNPRAFITTLLGLLQCRTDVQVADGKGMLLKYVTSYIMKMQEAAIAPEMVFQLSAIKAAWTDKLTKQSRPPHPGQEIDNPTYQLYLRRGRQDEDGPLPQ